MPVVSKGLYILVHVRFYEKGIRVNNTTYFRYVEMCFYLFGFAFCEYNESVKIPGTIFFMKKGAYDLRILDKKILIMY